jgi:tryptophanyl-tRNA synthetase
MYDSHVVPVGRDQKQHVEVTRDLAQKINGLYGNVLRVPEASIQAAVETIPGLDGRKMSKSYQNTIELFLEEKALRKKIMGIVTDSTPVEAPKDPTGSSIVALYRLFASETEVTAMEEAFRVGGTGYGHFKKQLFEAVWEYFRPMRERRAEWEREPGAVEAVLKAGGQKAGAVAVATMERVRRAVGLQ